MSGQTFYSVTLLTKAVLAKDIFELRFTKPAGFDFVAGQFVQFRVPDGEKFVLRSYSISSISTDAYLEFCIKILPDGKASTWFAQMAVGSTAELGVPRGMFVVQQAVDDPSYYIATGTGMAPVMSMVTTAAAADRLATAEVFFGVRSEEDLFWVDRLRALETDGGPLRVHITLSRPSESWVGLRGRVTDHLKVDSTAHYYICGSIEMVKDVRAKLLAGGVPTKNIHFEIF